MAVKTMKRAISLIILSLVTLTACDLEATLENGSQVQLQLEPTKSNVKVVDTSNGKLITIIDDIEFQIYNVPYEFSDLNFNVTLKVDNQTKYSANAQNDTGILVNGQPLKIIQGELFIGGQSYGFLNSGDQVIINNHGVQVNGQKRLI